MKFVEIFHYTTGVAHTWDLFGLRVSRLSALLLNFCHKKQENQAAIFIKSSVDAAQNAFTMFVNRTPLSVN